MFLVACIRGTSTKVYHIWCMFRMLQTEYLPIQSSHHGVSFMGNLGCFSTKTEQSLSMCYSSLLAPTQSLEGHLGLDKKEM